MKELKNNLEETTTEPKKIFAQKLREGKKFLINGQIETILKIIPMQDREGNIHDIELLLDKKNNRYFSYGMYYKDMSWVKTIDEV